MDERRILTNSFNRFILTVVACASLLACQEPEQNLAWMSPPQTQYSDAEPNWQYVAEVSSADAVFHLNGGADADTFVMDPITGALRFVTEPDVHSLQDADGDGVYEVELLATLDDVAASFLLEVYVLPSGSGAPHLSFPPPGSNLSIGNSQSETTLVRAEPEYRGKSLQSVSINGTTAQLNDHGFWNLEVDYPNGMTELLITANYEGDIETRNTVTVENVLQEPVASDGGLPLYASSAHQFMQDSGVLYYLEDGFLQQWNIQTGERQRMLGGHQFDNRIFFGVDEAEESIQIIDLGSSLDYPRQTLPASESRVVTLSRLDLATGDQEGETIPIELQSNPIFSAYQFDPVTNTFLVEERLLNSTLYVEPRVGVDIPFEKLSINADNGEVEEVNPLFFFDTTTDVANPSPDPLNERIVFDRIDIDWAADVRVGSACGIIDSDTAYVKDPGFGQQWWQVPRETKENYPTLCESYSVVRNPQSDNSYAAFYGTHGAELVEINLGRPGFHALKPLTGTTHFANGSSGSSVDLVQHISIDEGNQVLYISSTEIISFEVAEEDEPPAIVRDKLWVYSLISGSESIISESVYRLRTAHPLQRMFDAMFRNIFGLSK